LSINYVGNTFFSVFNHIKDLLVASGIGSGGVSGSFIAGWLDDDQLKRVRTRSDFNSADINQIYLPVITLDEGSADLKPLEIGSKANFRNQAYLISIYAENSIQLNRLIGELEFDINKTIDLKDYNTNYGNPSKVGTLHTSSIRTFHVRSTSPIKALRNNAEVLFTVSN